MKRKELGRVALAAAMFCCQVTAPDTAYAYKFLPGAFVIPPIPGMPGTTTNSGYTITTLTPCSGNVTLAPSAGYYFECHATGNVTLVVSIGSLTAGQAYGADLKFYQDGIGSRTLAVAAPAVLGPGSAPASSPNVMTEFGLTVDGSGTAYVTAGQALMASNQLADCVPASTCVANLGAAPLSAAFGRLGTYTLFTATSTLVIPPNTVSMELTECGGGASGGGVLGTATASGGTGGECLTFDATVIPGATLTCTIGGGGPAPTAGANNGLGGTASVCFGVTAGGGLGGVGASTGNATGVSVGAANASLHGIMPTVSLFLISDSIGLSNTGSGTTGGAGGPSVWGKGGTGVSNGAGNTGTGCGTGGAGAGGNTTAALSGGAGVVGCAMVKM